MRLTRWARRKVDPVQGRVSRHNDISLYDRDMTRYSEDRSGRPGRGGRGEHQHGRGFGWGPRGEWAEGGGGPWGGRRMRRGDMRGVLLTALVEGPAHGYEIITRLDERS